MQNSGYELKSHLCTLNSVGDHINDCTIRSRPYPNTAGKFGLGLSALPQTLHTAHTESYYCTSHPILCLLCTKEVKSILEIQCVHLYFALCNCDHASALTHNAASPNQFGSSKTISLICLLSNLLPNVSVDGTTINILPAPCFISNLREKKGFPATSGCKLA